MKLPSWKRLKKAFRNIVKTTVQGIRRFFDGALSQPKKFIGIMGLVIIAIIISYYASLCAWMIPLAGYIFFLYIGMPESRKTRAKRFKRLDIVISVFVATLLLLLGTLGFMIYEADRIHPATLPADQREPEKHNGWEVNDAWHREEAIALGIVRIVSNGYWYFHDYSPPYPGAIIVVTVKRVPAVSTEDLENELEVRLDGIDGLEINKGSRRTGSRQIFEGPTTQYFEYNGKIVTESDDPLVETFIPGARVKIRGEFWYCEEHGTTIGVLGGAMYGYDFEEGQYITDLRDWYTKEKYPDDQRTWTAATSLMGYVSCK